MTYTINRNGQKIPLNDCECWQIFQQYQAEFRREDVAQMIDNWAEDEEVTPECIAYLREHLEDAVLSYARCLDNEEGWSDYVRNALTDLVQDYETETGDKAYEREEAYWL